MRRSRASCPCNLAPCFTSKVELHPPNSKLDFLPAGGCVHGDLDHLPLGVRGTLSMLARRCRIGSALRSSISLTPQPSIPQATGRSAPKPNTTPWPLTSNDDFSQTLRRRERTQIWALRPSRARFLSSLSVLTAACHSACTFGERTLFLTRVNIILQLPTNTCIGVMQPVVRYLYLCLAWQLRLQKGRGQ